jgi:hypothetical protein
MANTRKNIKHFKFISRCRQHYTFLSVIDVMEILRCSRAKAYRLVSNQRFSTVEQEVLELHALGIIPHWNGWRVDSKGLIDESGRRYSFGEIHQSPRLKTRISVLEAMNRNQRFQ